MAGEINEKFGSYHLVVRAASGSYVAVLWRTADGNAAKKLLTADGASLEEARGRLEAVFYSELRKAAVTVDASKYASAWAYLWPKLTENQRKMIRAQYHASGRTLTTLQMAEAVGWVSHSSVNLWYGLAAFAYFGEVRQEISEKNSDGSPIYSFALSTGKRLEADERNLWAWTMRPEVAQGLVASGCVMQAPNL
jgi:hypothetical protein